MIDRGQLDDAPAALLEVLAEVVPNWLERCVVDTATRQLGSCADELATAAGEMAVREAPGVVAQLREVLAADVDEQRRAPLGVLRAAVVHPGSVLTAAGVPTPDRDEFERRAFPDDHYGLSPASWVDVDPRLGDPGIVWGAWKAATVLSRRRAEGKR